MKIKDTSKTLLLSAALLSLTVACSSDHKTPKTSATDISTSAGAEVAEKAQEVVPSAEIVDTPDGAKLAITVPSLNDSSEVARMTIDEKGISGSNTYNNGQGMSVDFAVNGNDEVQGFLVKTSDVNSNKIYVFETDENQSNGAYTLVHSDERVVYDSARKLVRETAENNRSLQEAFARLRLAKQESNMAYSAAVNSVIAQWDARDRDSQLAASDWTVTPRNEEPQVALAEAE